MFPYRYNLPVVAIACLVGLVAGASAAAATPPSGMALSFEDDNWYPLDSGPMNVPKDLHIVLVDPAFDVLHAWEAAVRSVGGQCLVLGNELVAAGTNSATGDEFRVVLDTPLPMAELVVLATIQVIPVTQESCFVLTGIADPSLPDPRPLVWPTADAPQAIATCDALANGVDAIIGTCLGPPDILECACEGIVADRQQSWGAIKLLYR